MEDDTREETSAGQVLAQLVLQVLVDIPHVNRLVVHSTGPERQPAEAGLEDPEPDGREAVHDAGAEEGGHRAHGAPGMGGETRHKWVVPEILMAGVTSREAVVDQ